MQRMAPRTRHSQETKDEAIRLQAEVGTVEAARRLGLSTGTVAAWVSRAGQSIPATPAQAAARASITASVIANTAARRTQIAEALLEDADRLRQQLFAPTIRREVKVVSGGQMREGRVEIVDVELDQPTFADQRHIVASVTGLLDKALLMLGEATERVEQLTATPRTPEVEAEVAKVLSIVKAA